MFRDLFKLNTEAAAPVIQIISHETLRIRACCIQAARDLNRDLYVWNMPQGLRKYDFEVDSLKSEGKGEQPQEALEWLIESSQDQSEFILLLEDFHHFLNEHTLISRLRAFAIAVASREINNVTVVLSQPAPLLPPELEKEVQVMEMPLPDTDDLKTLMQQAKQRY